MRYAILRKDSLEDSTGFKFLRRNRHDQYIFDQVPNVFFNTESAAINFVENNYSMITHLCSEEVELLIVPVNDKPLVFKIEEGDTND